MMVTTSLPRSSTRLFVNAAISTDAAPFYEEIFPRRVSSPDLLFPSHDRLHLENYPEAAQDITRLVLRFYLSGEIQFRFFMGGMKASLRAAHE